VSRRVAVCTLLVASGLLLLVGGALVYAQREFVDSSRFADRLVSALRSDDVRAALARQVAAAIEEGRPDLIAARPVIEAATARVAASSPFQAAVRAAAVELHASVFERHRETAELTVPDAGVLVVDAVGRASPQLAERLSASIESRSVSVVTVRDEATAAATSLEAVSAAGVPMLALAALAMAGALLLFGGARWRLVAVGLTVSGAGAVGLVSLAIGRAALLDRVTGGGQDRAAGGAVWDAYLGGLRGWCLAALVCGLVLAAAGALMRRPQSDRPAPPRARVVALTLAGAGLLVGGSLIARAVTTPEGPRFRNDACNGHRALCARRLDEVAFASTHNSMAAAAEPGWFFAQQEDGIVPQLEYGVRGLLIDSHYGVRTPRGIATDLRAEGKTRETLIAEVGLPFVRAAERLRGRIGFEGGDAKPELFLCHGACEVGATPMVPALEAIRDFAVLHPREVIVLSIQDDITPADTVDAFTRSGLLPLVYEGPSGPPWPTLGSLVDSGHRIVVFGENDTGGVPWYRPQFELVQDTPFGFRSPSQLEAPAGCDPNRGPPDASLFLLNHWVDTPPANKPSNAAIVNARAVLLGRARRCEQARDRLPNLIAVDFYRTGELLGVVDTLNGVSTAEEP
jgi:hypothetical protein